MTIHKEGTATISLIAVIVGLINLANFSYLYPVSACAAWVVLAVTLAFFLFMLILMAPLLLWIKMPVKQLRQLLLK